ncbi:VOC family protein [Nocardioides insulae]|uniref:VOC family protein n=1 Tax=Nocardioides insulae TaxID=394734 RepID=UPI00041857A6|nr:VOC family protein [Nocardioides insulae]
MIVGCHTLIYSDDAEATRAFLRDVVGLGHVDAGEGWLIFGTGGSELGIHPTSSEHGGRMFTTPRQHQISLLCDDLESTMAELEGRGAVFDGGAIDRDFGICAMLQVPGADDLMLYQPRHPTAYDA